MNEQDRADLSAFFDEEPVDMDRAIRLLGTDAGRAAWERQCLVRDALRGEPLSGASCDTVSRVRGALADEPVIFNPGARSPKGALGGPVTRNRQFAGLALAATVAGVAFLGLTQFNQGPPGNHVAGSATPSAADFPPVNGIGGAVVATDVRPVTRIVDENEDLPENRPAVSPSQP
ncbi:MAG: sigma-E factor negative regulatory protein [Pseudomonadota bacterium]